MVDPKIVSEWISKANDAQRASICFPDSCTHKRKSKYLN